MREGASIGPYRVLRKIGEGGMGAVYLGEHTLIGRHAAIKVLLPELSAQRTNVDRFFNEARATTAVTDPGIVQVFDFGFTPENIAYIVMEYLEGEQLDARLQRLGLLPPRDALRIARQAAGSLAAAHGAGIVHRDLKPDNLFMVRDPEALGGERPKLLDFGIAKLGDDVPNRMQTRTGQVIGTPLYMSPEQCKGAPGVDHRADIYSLGCMLFQMLTGRPPFDVMGMGPVISAHLSEPPPAPSTFAAHLPAAIDELVLRCLQKSPAARFQTMLELQAACDGVLALLGSGSAVTIAVPSGSLPRLPAPTIPIAPERKTTLGQSIGQSMAGDAPRSRLALWIGIGVLAAGVGATIAVITARGGGAPAAAHAAVPPAPTVDAAVAAEPPAPPTVPPPQPTIAPTIATPEPAPEPPPPVHVAKPAQHPAAKPPPRPAAKAKAKARPAEDLYDDRN